MDMIKENLRFEDLTTEQKLGMVYCARPMKDEHIGYAIELIKKRCLGSIQLSPKKPHHMEQVLAAADYPILIICDTETGFPTSKKQPIPLMTLSACDDEKYYEVFAKAIATEARAAGFNGTWGPVIDILHGNGPCEVHRHFSDDPEKISRTAEIMCRVFKRNGYMSCGKHYPGAKDKPYDSHMAPVPSDFTVEDIENKTLIPYRYLMERDLLPSIMTSHATLRQIDPGVSGTLSKKVQSIIRRTGWDGVCFTDSFSMMPILQKYGEENVLGMAIEAGNDIVLPNYRTPPEISFNHLVQNYKDGMISDERLDEAARRVLALQARLNEIPEAVDVFTDEDQVLYDSIAKDCITAITDDDVDVKLDSKKSKLFVILTDNGFAPDGETMEVVGQSWYHPDRIAEKIREVFPDAGIEFLPEYATVKDNTRVLVASTQYDEVVFITFCVTKPYLGTDCLTRRAESVIDAVNLADKLAAVVHFGNPYALQPLLHVKRKIFGYLMPDSQLHAIDVLAGKIPAKGKLPFNVKFQ